MKKLIISIFSFLMITSFCSCDKNEDISNAVSTDAIEALASADENHTQTIPSEEMSVDSTEQSITETEISSETVSAETDPTTEFVRTETETELPANTVQPAAATTAPTAATIRNVKLLTAEELSFYSNTLFIGDSVCSGLKLHNGLLDIQHVAAKGNIGSWSLDDYTFQYENSLKELDCYSIAELYKPEKIFIWLGMNDLFMCDTETRNQNLEKIHNKLAERTPDSEIYLVSISPISKEHKWEIKSNGNNRINRYNEEARKFCESTDNFEFINIHDALTENGCLSASFDSGDGLHLTASAYHVVLREIIEYFNEKENASEITEGTAESVISDDTAVTTVSVESTSVTAPEETSVTTVSAESTSVTAPEETSVTTVSMESSSVTAPEETSDTTVSMESTSVTAPEETSVTTDSSPETFLTIPEQIIVPKP